MDLVKPYLYLNKLMKLMKEIDINGKGIEYFLLIFTI
jgi:hypothetical protein